MPRPIDHDSKKIEKILQALDSAATLFLKDHLKKIKQYIKPIKPRLKTLRRKNTAKMSQGSLKT